MKANSTNLSDSLGIVGCGWVGKPLAEQLLQQQFSVVVTSSRADNVAKLIDKGLTAEQLHLPCSQEELVDKKVFAQQTLLIAITPLFRQGRTDYADKVKALVQAAKAQGKVKRLILLSSSAVYNGLVGEVTEASQLDLTADKVAILQQAEQEVLSFSANSVVMRLAGLVGPERHPGNFLRKKLQSNNNVFHDGHAHVNLIHQADVVGLLLAILQHGNLGGIYNGVSETNASKQMYYQTAAKSIGLPVPEFAVPENIAASKVVLGDKARRDFNYQFVYPDLLAWL
ncbi:NAD-dependent epimerase/dehydratase family protein [Litorilituus sediminis]|uniref:NAD-dependent epimerase/dehydratase family protein n=1 Tax=Litorilituus sediminis TaxID=718192 RepID=A0A4P6P8C5_9GAMM|nr:NAD-dependent epimerase/dehydratase family protein [Litorilituus sediminis]QBG35802.1 NAD-dependent epimerase/dehydratase family protein [Litorilituus sediminis]